MTEINVAENRHSGTLIGGLNADGGRTNVAGNFQGHSVREYPSQASLISDALEDVSAAVSDEVDIDLEKREVKAGDLKDIIDELLGLDGVAEDADRLADLDHGKLRQTLQLLLRQRFATSSQLRQSVAERHQDPSHQHAVLSALREALKRGGADARRIATVQRALDELEKAQGPRIRAGINVTPVASALAEGDTQALGALRQSYRDAVLGYAGMTETYRALLDQYGAAGLEKALKFLVAALGADLNAAAPSIDRTRLRAIVEDIYRLEVLAGLVDDCNEVMRHVDAKGQCLGRDLLGHVIDLVQDRWPTGEKIGRLPPRLCAQALESEILLLKELRELLRLLPLKIYTDDEQRPRLLDAAQDALDAAVDKEEAEA